MSSEKEYSQKSAMEAPAAAHGLSDLARSPFGLPLALHAKDVRVAWAGRTSTEEHQDPRQSLLRQLSRSKSALPESWVVVCHFYDVESGRMELERRGQRHQNPTSRITRRCWTKAGSPRETHLPAAQPRHL